MEKIVERVSLQDMQSRLTDVKEALMRIGFRQELGRYLIGHASLLRVQVGEPRPCVVLFAPQLASRRAAHTC